MKFVLFVTLIWSILDSGWSITDDEYIQFKAGLAQIQVLTKQVQYLMKENQAGRKQNQALLTDVAELKSKNKQIHLRVDHLQETCGAGFDEDLAQNTTIEERVTILEGEMTIIQNEVAEVEDQVAFLFDEQILQDERILTLEQDTEGLEERVEVLEANGGGGGNVTALEERVETLEGTAAQHEAEIADLESATSSLDGRVETLEGETSELDTRLTSTETQIEDLQATDIELDSRISDLEEGGGGATNGTTIAFRAVMDTSDGSFPEDTTIIFSDVQVNQGSGYNSTTGVFTVPSGGSGYYYIATHFTMASNSYAYFDLQVNNVIVCTIYDNNDDVDDQSSAGCNAVIFLEEGDEVWNVYRDGSDSSPVYEATGVFNGFTGFRI